jgi:hypothetical protein
MQHRNLFQDSNFLKSYLPQINAREFASVFNLPSGDALPQLHLFDQMTDKEKRKFYTRGAKKIGFAAEPSWHNNEIKRIRNG